LDGYFRNFDSVVLASSEQKIIIVLEWHAENGQSAVAKRLSEVESPNGRMFCWLDHNIRHSEYAFRLLG